MTTHERFEITRNGRRAAVLLSADDYDTLQETITVLSDAELLAAHREGQAAIDAGDYLDVDQLAHAMREAGACPGEPAIPAAHCPSRGQSPRGGTAGESGCRCL